MYGENGLNSDSDWPHGSADAALDAALVIALSPFCFNICRVMKCDGEKNCFLVMQMMFVTPPSTPAETNI